MCIYIYIFLAFISSVKLTIAVVILLVSEKAPFLLIREEKANVHSWTTAFWIMYHVEKNKKK